MSMSTTEVSSIVEKLKVMKSSFEQFLKVSADMDSLDKQLNPEKQKVSKVIKVIVFIALSGIFIKIGDWIQIDNQLGVIKFIYNVISLGIPLYIVISWMDKMFTKMKGLSSEEKEKAQIEYDRLEREWTTLAKDIFDSKLLESKYIHPDYIVFLIDAFEYNRAKTLPEALNLLDDEIRHIEKMEAINNIASKNEEMMEVIKSSNEAIYETMKNMEGHLEGASKNLKAIRKDISWTAYNTSALRERSYIGKWADDKLRN